MADNPDKPVEKKDPLVNLGNSVSDGQIPQDIYSLPTVVAYLDFKQKSSETESQLLEKCESEVRGKGGRNQHRNLSAIIRSLANKDLICHSNFLRVKSEIIFGALGNDNDLRTDTNNMNNGKLKGSG